MQTDVNRKMLTALSRGGSIASLERFLSAIPAKTCRGSGNGSGFQILEIPRTDGEFDPPSIQAIIGT
jgi:hypothetical protein